MHFSFTTELPGALILMNNYQLCWQKSTQKKEKGNWYRRRENGTEFRSVQEYVKIWRQCNYLPEGWNKLHNLLCPTRDPIAGFLKWNLEGWNALPKQILIFWQVASTLISISNYIYRIIKVCVIYLRMIFVYWFSTGTIHKTINQKLQKKKKRRIICERGTQLSNLWGAQKNPLWQITSIQADFAEFVSLTQYGVVLNVVSLELKNQKANSLFQLWYWSYKRSTKRCNFHTHKECLSRFGGWETMHSPEELKIDLWTVRDLGKKNWKVGENESDWEMGGSELL